MEQNRLKSLLEAISKGLYERDEAIAIALLSAIAGESIFLLGLPGVGKSLVGRRLKLAFQDATSFEYLMSRFSTPDEIFGPISISKLKDEDTYERITDGYLPTSDIVFLDEIWKAGPSIQNSLLTVLNEKIFRNGRNDIYLPIKGIIAASNELPAKNEGLEALWDRFLIRMIVSEISDRKAFEDMITSTSHMQIEIHRSLQITAEEYEQWQAEINSIEVEPFVLDIIAKIREELTQINTNEEDAEMIIVSDRRWKKIIRLVRTSALLNDRESVDISDMLIIPYCIWSEEEQIEVTREIVVKAISDYIIGKAAKKLDEIESRINALEDIPSKGSNVPSLYNGEYYKIKKYGAYGVYNTYIRQKLYETTPVKYFRDAIIVTKKDNNYIKSLSIGEVGTNVRIKRTPQGLIVDGTHYLLECKIFTEAEILSLFTASQLTEIEVLNECLQDLMIGFKSLNSEITHRLKENIFCFNYTEIAYSLKQYNLRLRRSIKKLQR